MRKTGILSLASMLVINAAAASSSWQLEKVVEIDRHSVRPPTVGNQKAMEAGSDRRWPAWQTAAGELTAHGYQAAVNHGRYAGESARESGMLADGCPDADAVYIRASPLQRTRATAEALAEGAFPGCKVPVHVASGYDPLFQSEHLSAAALDPHKVHRATLQAAGGDLNTLQHRLRADIARLQQAVCQPGKPCPTFAQRWQIEPGGDGRASIRGLRDMADMAESIRLAWSNHNPLSEVAFGHVRSADDVAALLPLLTINYDLTNDVPYIAQRRGAVLLDQVSKALQSEATANAPPATRWLVLVGHDTNIAYLRTLLGFHWQLGNYPRGNIPPASRLVFERWRDMRSGDRFLRIYFQAQSLDQLRNLTPLNAQQPPLEQEFSPEGCEKREPGMLCPYSTMMTHLRAAVDNSATTQVEYD